MDTSNNIYLYLVFLNQFVLLIFKEVTIHQFKNLIITIKVNIYFKNPFMSNHFHKNYDI
jgi:hypothetical protein